jgi:hypothetical protein
LQENGRFLSAVFFVLGPQMERIKRIEVLHPAKVTTSAYPIPFILFIFYESRCQQVIISDSYEKEIMLTLLFEHRVKSLAHTSNFRALIYYFKLSKER